MEGQELECEIGVVVDGAGSPLGLVPVVEVVYLAFSRREDLSIANALAVNLGADRYICGDVAPWHPGLAEVAINVWKDDVQVATVINEYSFGSPDCGASWIVAEATKRNLWQPGAENCLLILGTCGAPLKGEKGNYRFAFGELGEVCLRVR